MTTTTKVRIVNYSVELFAPDDANESDPDPRFETHADEMHTLVAAVNKHVGMEGDSFEWKIVLNDPDTNSTSFNIMRNGRFVAVAVVYMNG